MKIINVIYDEEKAVREKQEVDARHKKLSLPMRIINHSMLELLC